MGSSGRASAARSVRAHPGLRTASRLFCPLLDNVIERRVVPRLVHSSFLLALNGGNAKRSGSRKRKLGPAAAAAHLQSTGGTVLRDMVTTRGRVPAMSARSGGQVLKQERVPERRHSVTAWMVLTKLRVNLGLTIATMAE